MYLSKHAIYSSSMLIIRIINNLIYVCQMIVTYLLGYKFENLDDIVFHRLFIILGCVCNGHIEIISVECFSVLRYFGNQIFPWQIVYSLMSRLGFGIG